MSEIDESERRSESDSKLRDRRVIERMGDPQLRKNLRSTRVLCNVGVIASLLFVAVLIGRHVHDSTLELNRSIFFGVVLVIIAFGLQHLGSSIGSYIENESKSRLIAVSERLFHAFFLFVVTGLVLGAAYVVTLF